MHPPIQTHREELLALARRRGVSGVRVFGSMSRGDGSDDSDVDLLVTLLPGTSGLASGGLLLDAQELLGRRVDVMTEANLGLWGWPDRLAVRPAGPRPGIPKWPLSCGPF